MYAKNEDIKRGKLEGISHMRLFKKMHLLYEIVRKGGGKEPLEQKEPLNLSVFG